MIYLNKGTLNKVVLTLTESSILPDPFYIFIFENEYNIEEEPIICYFTDISSYRNRYNLFEIEESDLGNTTGGYNVPISFISGQYSYKVYESETSPDDLLLLSVDIPSYILNLNIVETGRMVVSGCEDNIEEEVEDNFYS